MAPITREGMERVAEATLGALRVWPLAKVSKETPHAHLAMAGALATLRRSPIRHEVAVAELNRQAAGRPFQLDFVVGGHGTFGQTLIELTVRQETPTQPNWYLTPSRPGEYFTGTVKKLLAYEHQNFSHNRYLVLIDRSSHPQDAATVINEWLEWDMPRRQGRPRVWEGDDAGIQLVYCSWVNRQPFAVSRLIRPYRAQGGQIRA